MSRTAQTVEIDPLNEIALRGRITGAPVPRTLPSGDEVVQFRVAVGRTDGGADALECSAWTAGLRKRVGAWQVGDVIEVEGALRRRFWRGPTGPSSRYDIEVHAARRVHKGS